jgi:RNase P subunit RPR2
MNFYLLFFLLIIIVGLVVSYIYFMKDKSDQLRTIQEGICPKCHKESMELVDQRRTGCSGPKMMTFECNECKYISTFHIDSQGSCGSGRCGI